MLVKKKKKNYLVETKSDGFKKNDFLQKNATIAKELYTLWMSALFVKAARQLELFLQEKDTCLIIFCSYLQ